MYLTFLSVTGKKSWNDFLFLAW